MTFSFFRTYADVTDFDVPGSLKVQADSVHDALELIATEHGWKVTDWNEQAVWFQTNGKDLRYSITRRGKDEAL